MSFFFLQFAGRAEGTRGAHVQTNHIQRTMADVTPFQNDSCGFPNIALDIFQTVTAITYKVVKVVHRNRSDNHCNWSDTVVHTTTRTPLANTEFHSLSSTHTHTHTHTHTPHTRNTHTHAHMGKCSIGMNKLSPNSFSPSNNSKTSQYFHFFPPLIGWKFACV